MDLALVLGTSQPDLGRAMARALGLEPVPCAIRSFPDGELDVTLEQPVRGSSVHVLQATCPPVGERLLELLLLCDACWRAPVQRLITTDSVSPPARVPFPHQVVGLGPLLADAVRRLEERRSLAGLLASR